MRNLFSAVPVVNHDVYHAIYSARAAAAYGSGIWLDVDGREVEVTCVDPSAATLAAVGWPDKVYVGRVTRRLRQGQPDLSPRRMPKLGYYYDQR